MGRGGGILDAAPCPQGGTACPHHLSLTLSPVEIILQIVAHLLDTCQYFKLVSPRRIVNFSSVVKWHHVGLITLHFRFESGRCNGLDDFAFQDGP